MRTWTRAKLTQACGRCGDLIETGDPLLELTLALTTKVRCVACEGPAPADLPTHVVLAADATKQQALDTLTRIRNLMPQLPIDFKVMSAGEREPGEEG